MIIEPANQLVFNYAVSTKCIKVISFLTQIKNLGERHRFSFYFFNHITFNSKSWWTTFFFKCILKYIFLLRNKFSFLKHVSISSRGSMIGNDDDQAQ